MKGVVDMEILRKDAGLLLAGVMVFAGLATFGPLVSANETVTIDSGTPETYTLVFNDANMVSHAGVAAADEQIQINEAGDGTADSLIYLGEDELQLQFQVTASADPGVDVQFQIQGSGPVSAGTDTGGTVPAATFPATQTITFTVDTSAAGVVEALYDLTVRIIEDPSGAPQSASIVIQVYVSSILHDRTSDGAIDAAHEMAMDPATGEGDYIKDSGDDYPLEAGDEFKEAFFGLNNNAHFAVTDPRMDLTAPTGIELVRTYAQFVGDVAAGGDEDLLWRVNVAAGTAPGVYRGTAVLSYIRNVNGADVLITEQGRPIDYTVDYSFADDDPVPDGELYSGYQCYATGVEIVNYTREEYPTQDAEQEYTDQTAELVGPEEAGEPVAGAGAPVWAWAAAVGAVALAVAMVSWAMIGRGRKG